MDFAAIDTAQPPEALQYYLTKIPASKLAHLKIDAAEFQLLIASRVNALES